MASSCKRSLHRHLRYEVQHQHRCNKFTTKMHFNNALVLPVVAFVSVFMFSYQSQVFAEETKIVAHEIEFTTKHVAHIPENKVNIVENATIEASNIKNNSTNVEFITESTNDATRFYALDLASTQNPGHAENRLHSGVKNKSPSQVDEKLYSSLEHTADINNDIFSNVEENPQYKISPDFVNSNGDYPVSTENLEESIRNSVKTEMELEQHLESSPVLEILKELPEPEIRKTFTADIMSLDQQNFDDNAMLLKDNEEIIEESSESILKILKTGFENKTTRDAKNLEYQVPTTHNDQINLSSESRSQKDNIKTDEISKAEEEAFKPLEMVSEIRNTSVVPGEKLVHSSIKKENTTEAEHSVVQETITSNNEFAQEFESSSESYSGKAKNFESSNTENLEYRQFKNDSHENVNSSLSSSSESNSFENSEENLSEKGNGSNTSLSESENSEEFFKDNVNNFSVKKTIENVDKTSSKDVGLPIEAISHELHSMNSSDLTDIAMFKKNEGGTSETKDDALSVVLTETYSATLLKPTDKNPVDNINSRDTAIFSGDENLTTEYEEDALSVVLNETFSTNSLNPEYENHFSIEEKRNVSLDLMRELDIEQSTTIPEEFKHVVIKKVLDVQEIYDDSFETTVIPFAIGPIVKQIIYDDLEYQNKQIDNTAREITQDEQTLSSGDENDINQKDINPEQIIKNQSNFENAKHVKPNLQPNRVLPKCDENGETETCAENAKQEPPYEILVPEVLPSTTESISKETTESLNYLNVASTTASNFEFHIVDSTALEDVDHAKTVKGSRSVGSEFLLSHHKVDSAAALFEAYPPQDAGQTINDNLADEYAGIGKALPVSIKDGSNRSTIIIILSSGTAFLFIVISVTIFLISFQRQHGTLDIEMQERNCGKDDLDEEDAETFAKLLEVELPPSVAIALDETDECL